MVVCLAAINSMDVGRRKLLTLKLSARTAGEADAEIGPRQAGTRPRGVSLSMPNSEKPRVAQALAVVDFWGRLQDFVAVKSPLKGAGTLGASHPFLHIVEGVLKVNMTMG